MKWLVFYSLYRFESVGKYHIKVCDSISCKLCGSAGLLQYLEQKLGIRSGETTSDQLFSLGYAECIAACTQAPALIVNDKDYHGNMTKEKVDALIAAYQKEPNDMDINTVCLRTLEKENPSSLATYEALGGYSAWRRIIQEKTDPAMIIDQIKQSNLRGRGGAGFSTGLKWTFMPKDRDSLKYLVCNSDEGEPGTCKDGLIMTHNPHQLLEGIAIACYTLGIETAYNYLRGEFIAQYDSCEAALAEAVQAGLLGDNILGSDININIFNVLGAGSYIVGEETAMLESLEGKRAMPRYKPPFPAHYGLYGRPTTINNTETLASIPVIMEKGADWFAELGTGKSGGTKIFCVSGHVAKPGSLSCH